jgi:hypothetical protein
MQRRNRRILRDCLNIIGKKKEKKEINLYAAVNTV